MIAIVGRLSNGVLSVCAGVSAFVLTLVAFLLLEEFDEQLVAALSIGLFALLVVWVASEKPNSRQARAIAALVDRILAVGTGDLSSPAPKVLREEMPALASAVDGLFKQVRSNIENVHAMAMYDPVTSLPNRVHFRREVERILRSRPVNDPLALLFVDLDGFKEVNDSLGHAKGDEVLTEVAQRLRAVVKEESDAGTVLHPVIARLAGDEFTLLLPSLREASEADRIARELLIALHRPYELGDQHIDLGASIGIASWPNHGIDLASLMRSADLAMYHAKASGRGRVCVFDPALAAASDERASLERALREAVAARQFQLAFLPQLSARSTEIVAAEALVRWNHPVLGRKLADFFIGIAEESSLIVDIGDWVAEEAARTLARWQSVGLGQRLSINISPRQLDRADFFDRMRATFARAGAPLELLELEFTETLAMQCSEEIVREMAAIRAAGVSIAIDDFGVGYSNLARMKDMPIDRVKLASSLTRDVDTAESARTIVAAVVHLVHGLGAEVVAKGVERTGQYDVLRAVGCDLVQGYAFAEPMSEPAFVRWVGDRVGRRAVSA